MRHPFELTVAVLEQNLDEMVTATFGDLQSQFFVLPKKGTFIECRTNPRIRSSA